MTVTNTSSAVEVDVDLEAEPACEWAENDVACLERATHVFRLVHDPDHDTCAGPALFCTRHTADLVTFEAHLLLFHRGTCTPHQRRMHSLVVPL